ncbi:hypothetical protein HZS_3012 [Henneguya salminicola]|nr:hypothetical protein HZS_3012 [Henneguya salminicola]
MYKRCNSQILMSYLKPQLFLFFPMISVSLSYTQSSLTTLILNTICLQTSLNYRADFFEDSCIKEFIITPVSYERMHRFSEPESQILINFSNKECFSH